MAMLDLDGVVYIGDQAVLGVAEHLAAATSAGMSLAYVTNNASRAPSAVAAHLRRLGVPAEDSDVVTSAQAAARLLAVQHPRGSSVFVIGGDGLYTALREQHLKPTQDPDADPRAVVSGFAPDLRWMTVVEGALLVRAGLPWVATNTDLTVPTARGPGLGNGVLVRAVAEYSQATPVVAGKPEPTLFEETQRRMGGVRPLVVGDRLDTDIEGAVRAGYDSLLVMTGVTTLDTLLAATPPQRPTYLGWDLASLGRRHPQPALRNRTWHHEGWTAEVTDGSVSVAGDGDADGWLQVVAAAGWHHRDETGAAVDASLLRPRKP